MRPAVAAEHLQGAKANLGGERPHRVESGRSTKGKLLWTSAAERRVVAAVQRSAASFLSASVTMLSVGSFPTWRSAISRSAARSSANESSATQSRVNSRALSLPGFKGEYASESVARRWGNHFAGLTLDEKRTPACPLRRQTISPATARLPRRRLTAVPGAGMLSPSMSEPVDERSRILTADDADPA